jgi:hypothetical protein
VGRSPASQPRKRSRGLFGTHLYATAKNRPALPGIHSGRNLAGQDRLSLVAGTKVLKTNYTGSSGGTERPACCTRRRPPRRSGRLTRTDCAPLPTWSAISIFPASWEIRSSGLPIFACFSANPNFRSEQLNGYELGYRGLEGRQFYVDIAGFYNHYGDLFSEDLVEGPYVVDEPASHSQFCIPAQFGNGLVASTTGMEVAPEWRPSRGGAWAVRTLIQCARLSRGRLRPRAVPG